MIFSVDEFKGQICHDYPNCVISSLLLPDPVQQRSPPKSHDLSETATGEARTHPQSSIELPARELCCSSCGKDGVGSCSSSKRTTGVSESKSEKQDVESGERDVAGQTRSSEEAEGLRVSERGVASTAREKKSDEGDVSSKFSNKDDVITQSQAEKCDDQTSGGGDDGSGVSRGVTEGGDTTRTDVKSSIPLGRTSSMETGAKVRTSVVQYRGVVCVRVWGGIGNDNWFGMSRYCYVVMTMYCPEFYSNCEASRLPKKLQKFSLM